MLGSTSSLQQLVETDIPTLADGRRRHSRAAATQ
jgi:hypothetical protein